MKSTTMRRSFLLFTVLLLVPLITHAQVTGRIVRIEAPASSGMGLHQIEIWSGGANIALKNKAIKVAGIGYRGGDINARTSWRLFSGEVDMNKRSLEMTTAGGVGNPWVEIDLGRELPLEKLVFSQPLKPLYDDRAVRLVTVLDKDRRVVWAVRYDVRRAPCAKGVASFTLEPQKGDLVGRIVPANTAKWAPLGDVLEVAPASVPPDAKARAMRYAQRNSPAAIEQLAKEFFARMDLTKPELAEVRTKFEARNFVAALDAYRDHFLAKLSGLVFIDAEPPGASTPYSAAADDLLHDILVVFARYDVAAEKFTPGVIDWAAVPVNDRGGVDVARMRDVAGKMPNPLLLAYRGSGQTEYLAKWAAIADDWGMNIRADLDRASAKGKDLRNYFVLDPGNYINHLAENLAKTAQKRPELSSELPGATLARLLIPVLEELPPAYWWVCRQASFNHTYNGMDAATLSSRILDDFYAGERLDNENRRHWQKIWTSNMTRDGSMNEIGGEGHMFMQWRMAFYFDQMKRTPPPWFTPDFAAEFETGWRQTALYSIRHLAPDGYGHRLGKRNADYFGRLWWLIDPKTRARELPPSETIDFTDIVRQPEFASVMQTVFGAGRDRAKLPPLRQGEWDKVTGFYGRSFTSPTTVSDWMPYAGLWYLRGSWEPDAAYVHMICQPKGHPSTNGSDWNTELYYFDFGQPILGLSPVWIDGRPPFNEAGTQTYKPGSKTETLATASEFPIPARWHTSSLLDYAESFYEGTYQAHQEQNGKENIPSKPLLGATHIPNARADRRVILFRPAQLLIVTDAVRVLESAKPQTYEIHQRFATRAKKDKLDQPPAGKFKGTAANLTLVNIDAPSVTVRRFTTAKLSWDKRNTPDAWATGAAMMDHTGIVANVGGILRAEAAGGLLMSALIEPQPTPTETVVRSTTDLSAEGVTGFKAVLNEGATLIWMASSGIPRRLEADAITLEGDGLLVWQSKGAVSGLVLGAKSLHIDGKGVALPATDFEFTLKNGVLAGVTPIHRPISPVTFSPQETVFTSRIPVTLKSETPGVEIRYTLDGKEPDTSSPLYTGPLTIDKDAFIRARAFRPGVKTIPFTTAGTDVTVVSDARYYRRNLKPAVAVATNPVPGLRWELVDGNWLALFTHLNLPEVMPAKSHGETTKLLDVSMRQGDGPFGVRYNGFLNVPADGIWTFHAPAEYVGATCVPGYDLRVWIDGEEWDLGQRFHGLGLWSVPLAKGAHRLLVTFADARNRDRTVHNSGLWGGYPSPWVVWKGEAPVIEISGPNVTKEPIPSAWLKQEIR
jgi:hypothetical protein